jgi:uncharacterized protein (TIGR03083 family)
VTALLPSGLRDRVLAAARAARPPGRAVPEPPPISPAEVFGRAVDAFGMTLDRLNAEDWTLPALRDLTVQGLVGHLVGVERDLQRAFDDDPVVADADHVSSTQATARRQSAEPPRGTLQAWRAATAATVSRLAADDLDRVIALHGLRLPLRSLLVVRAFELWTHENDIRAAAGLPPSVPDPCAVPLMTELATGRLPRVAVTAGIVEHVDLHLVLTGPGGGTWDLALGDRTTGPPAPEVTIVTDAIDFCRLAANRRSPDQLDAHISGATTQAPRILAATAALALD